MKYPPWVVFHIPHNSIFVPHEVREQFLLDDSAFDEELVRMTDFWTLALYGNGLPYHQMVIAPVNRLVVDVERFEDDAQEGMSKIGMGVVYSKTHKLLPLRRNLTPDEKMCLIEKWYRPHHLALTSAVQKSLDLYGKALVVDLHSFPSKQLPYEGEEEKERPEVCIGTDSFHTDSELARAFHESFGRSFDTGFNSPFSGALVPMRFYLKDSRVQSVMIETNRALYENEDDASLAPGFVRVSEKLKACLRTAVCAF